MRKIILFVFLSVPVFQGILFAQNTDEKKDTANAPVAIISLDDLDQNSDESDNVATLLQASRDPFLSTAGYTFGQARFRVRGLGSEYSTISINGVNLNDEESGRVFWSTWGGLNDVTRFKDIKSGVKYLDFSFGEIGGGTNIEIRPSLFRKGTKITYSASNRSYRNRLMATVSTGLMSNGWAFTFSGSRRWSQEGYVEGTFYDGWSYLFSGEKKLNDNHSLTFTILGAPTARGKAGISTQEAYNLAGTNFYNPYWGYQNGKKRNARVSDIHKPIIMLNHYWTINDKTKLQTGLTYVTGKVKSSALNWYDARDPRPDYYRNLPSYYYYYDSDIYQTMLDEWKNDVNVRQVNWDFFYFANGKNLYTVHDVDGVAGNDITGNRSKYIVENRVTAQNTIKLNSILKHEVNDNIYLISGIDATVYRGDHYKQVEDLLGGDFWLDIDKFAERDFEDPTLAQSDLNHPNHIVKEGDKFGYDYIANINQFDAYSQAKFTYGKLNFYTGVKLSSTIFWRTGKMKNGKFPENSYGNSDKASFFNYSLKGGLTYQITGRHFITTNLMYETRPPLFRNSFMSPRTRNTLVPNLESETVYGGDLNYYVRLPFVKGRITGYYTKIKNQTTLRSFYHDEYQAFINYIMTGVDKQMMGLELGLEFKLSPTITATLVGTKGEYIYTSRPLATVVRDNSEEVIAENKTVYLKNYYLGNTPQTAGSVGFKYRSPKYWFIGLNANYYDDIYIVINPERRTETAVDNLLTSDPQWKEMLDQEKFNSFYTIDMYGGKSWKIMHKYYLAVNLSINNLLNSTDNKIGGYEQYRYNINNMDKFPPKYYYMYGLTYFLNVNLRF